MASQTMPTKDGHPLTTGQRMDSSDDRTSLPASEPHSVYTDVFVKQMLASGFDLVSQNYEDPRQLHCRFGWTSEYIDTNIQSLLYGRKQTIIYEVDVVGIPYGSFLLLQALFVGKNASQFETIKLKLRCLPSAKGGNFSPSSSPPFGPTFSFSSSPPSSSSFSPTLEGKESETEKEKTEFQKEYEENRLRIENELLPEFIQKIISVFSVQLDDLPLEIKFLVLSMLPLNSLVNMACVSSLWRDISLDEYLWKLMVKRHFPDLYKKRVFGQSWKALFKEEFRRLRVLNRRRAFSLGQDRVLLALPPSPRILPIGPPPNFPMLLPRQRQLEIRAPFYMQEFINGPQMDL